MAHRKQTYSWILLLVFVLGGSVAPTLHFQQHVSEEAPRTVADPLSGYGLSSADAADCSLCDATLLAPSLGTTTQEVGIVLKAMRQHPPQRPVLPLIGKKSSRDPPVHT